MTVWVFWVCYLALCVPVVSGGGGPDQRGCLGEVARLAVALDHDLMYVGQWRCPPPVPTKPGRGRA